MNDTTRHPELVTIRTPFLIVNPKAYLGSADTLKLARLTDELAGQFDVDVIFTAQHVDLRLVAEHTSNLIVTAQHMDPLVRAVAWASSCPTAGGGRRPCGGAQPRRAPATLAVLDETMQRAREVGLLTIVCADLTPVPGDRRDGPDLMICEPTANIGTGQMDAGDYIERTTRIVKDVDPSILVIQAAGISSGADVAAALRQGADGSGGTSGIVTHPDWRAILTEMFTAVQQHRG